MVGLRCGGKISDWLEIFLIIECMFMKWHATLFAVFCVIYDAEISRGKEQERHFGHWLPNEVRSPFANPGYKLAKQESDYVVLYF